MPEPRHNNILTRTRCSTSYLLPRYSYVLLECESRIGVFLIVVNQKSTALIRTTVKVRVAMPVNSGRTTTRRPIRLHRFRIGVILVAEQFDVRRLLLADSPTAPAPGAPQFFPFSNFDFRISLQKDFPWLHYLKNWTSWAPATTN